MTTTTTLNLCPTIPGVGDDLTITLPFGGEMKAIRDLSQGIPDDCAMTFNLLVQLQPLLGGIGCLLKILDTLSTMQKFFGSTTPFEMVDNAVEVAEKLGELAVDCLPPAIYFSLMCMVADILKLIIKVLSCLIEFLDSINSFNAMIDFDTAQGNPALLEILDCAQSNSQLTLEHLLAALGPLKSIFAAIEPVIGFVPDLADLSIELPSFEDISPDANLSEVTDKLKEAVDTLEKVVDAIPC
jgi:hypothetical protein